MSPHGSSGVFLIAGGHRAWRRSSRAHDCRRALGLITGLAIAGYSVIDGYAIKVLAIDPIIFDYLCNVLRVPLQLPAGPCRSVRRCESI
jgi:hypothetical protein